MSATIYYFLRQGDAVSGADTSRAYYIGISGLSPVRSILGITSWTIGYTDDSLSPSSPLIAGNGYGTSSNSYYYLYPTSVSVKIVYYNNPYDANNKIDAGFILQTNNYLLQTIGSNGTWAISAASLFSSQPTQASYNSGDYLTPNTSNEIYYVYPYESNKQLPNVYYFNIQDNIPNINSNADLSWTQYAIKYTNDLTVGSYYGFANWKIISNYDTSKGASTTLTVGDALNKNTYFLAPISGSGDIKIITIYYSNQTDAIAKSVSILGSDYLDYGDKGNWTVHTQGGFSTWKLASSSTGTSSQNSTYNTGDTLGTQRSDNIQVAAIYYLYPVASNITYYSSQADAIAGTNSIYTDSGSYTVSTRGGFSKWKIATTNSGMNTTLIYPSGAPLDNSTAGGAPATYALYPVIPCFLEGTDLLCLVEEREMYVPIQNIRKGMLVKTALDGYKKVELIGKRKISNPGNSERYENRLYKCSKAAYPELKKDLFITGCHSILVDELTDTQRADTIKSLERIFVTDNKYRLMAWLDERAEPWVSEGMYTVWHLALEATDERIRYGVYANGTLLTETTSLRFLKERCDMDLM